MKMETMQRKLMFLMLFLCLVIEIRCQYGKTYDICSKNPCQHKGFCVQTSNYPGYKCQCHGTGFHGDRCQHKCPSSTINPGARIPSECIVI